MEAFDSLSGVTLLFDNTIEIPGPGYSGYLAKAFLATHPVLALTALVFAAIGHMRGAILALAAITFMALLNLMPSVVQHGFDLPGMSALMTSAQIVVFPLMAAGAIACAIGDQRLDLAVLLVSVPTLVNLVNVMASALGVTIHGF
ncbi:hypothetical protein JQ596_10580 [Bradyrhizobium manausense]|uniref:hypothetical protein n=1 Tax=Bradyrhizobium TaxID=374 RepID=UPI001BA78648|nr:MULTISPECIES: hypothetical protein [Bradyrhizobium]MBR0825983.1 hypothetical protein [Bradyrhizobium manausense]UVO31982.1 hypothetical protein KUF59_15820 [Bradyrhizobium arachidis]